MVWCMVQ